MIKNLVKATALVGLLVGSVQASEVEVKIVNNTGYSNFTPLLVAAHPSTSTLFTVGEAASVSLQMMAEGGNTAGLETDLSALSANVVANPAGGLLAPGINATATLTTDTANDSLSIVAMILPTNDGFIALNNWKIPTTPGEYTVNLNAYDAGTEANDEIINGAGAPGMPGIPADPSGNGGTGATGMMTTIEGFVHIHRGVLGDSNATGGKSDLDSIKHRWLNPVATAIITVK